jgi:hypothetical protein
MSAQRLVLLTLMAFNHVGCVEAVKPWERGNLAKPQMALTPDEQQSNLMLHTYSSKEASTGGYGVGGGGCGCN